MSNSFTEVADIPSHRGKPGFLVNLVLELMALPPGKAAIIDVDKSRVNAFRTNLSTVAARKGKRLRTRTANGRLHVWLEDLEQQ